jgi:ligand-binding SRPBCC domain-containing protein
MKGTDGVKALVTNPELHKRLAKYLVHRCFRNSALEDLHAGTAPGSKTGDYSDVTVVTPFGEIPWRRLSRLDDGEMKTLMIDVVQRTYEFIGELFDEELGGSLLLSLAERDPLPR